MSEPEPPPQPKPPQRSIADAADVEKTIQAPESSELDRQSDKTYAAGVDDSGTRIDVEVRRELEQAEASHRRESGEADAGDDLCGQTLDGFRVLRTLGQGGMARVYLAEQEALRRQVALKVMQPEMLAKKDSIERFKSEAMAAAGLSHGNIVQVYTVGQALGKHYIAMEYVAGRNLRQLVRRTGPLPLGHALKVMRQAASALRAAGEAGIVHRDIKPANIMVSRRGIIKVADFGLSIAPNIDRESGELTAVGQTVGTPRYMSPEQVEGRVTDHRSDIYSLGVTFYYLLAGRSPFDGETPVQIALQHLKAEAPSLLSVRPDLPPEVAGLVHRMMAKEPSERPQAAAEVVDVLRRLTRAYGDDGADDSLNLTIDQPSRKAGGPSLRQRLTNLLGSRAAAVRSPKYLIVPLLACLLLGVLAGLAMRPPDPLAAGQSGLGVPRAADVEAQYIDAMFAGTPESFAAVEIYWPYDRVWTERARRQLLHQLLRDARRRRESFELIDRMRKSPDPTSQLVAEAADALVDVRDRSYTNARSKLRALEPEIERLPRLWRSEIEDAAELVEESSAR